MNLTPIASAQEEAPTLNTETAPANESLFSSLGIHGTLLIEQWINFAVIACVVWFLILKPITRRMSERQRIVDESLKNAKKVQQNLEESEKEFNAKIAEAKAEANKIIEKAHGEASALSAQMKEKAKVEIEVLVEQAKKNIRIEKDEMVTGLKKETADLVVTALEKILGEKMNGSKDKEMIAEMLQKIK